MHALVQLLRETGSETLNVPHQLCVPLRNIRNNAFIQRGCVKLIKRAVKACCQRFLIKINAFYSSVNPETLNASVSTKI